MIKRLYVLWSPEKDYYFKSNESVPQELMTGFDIGDVVRTAYVLMKDDKEVQVDPGLLGERERRHYDLVMKDYVDTLIKEEGCEYDGEPLGVGCGK